RMLGMSNSSHRAAEAGQMSLFGALDGGATSVMDTIGALPKLEEVSLKEKLTWEKELIGAQVSEHPVGAAIAQLQSEITHLSSELTEEAEGQRAVMVVMVTGTRLITTKKGDAMGFVQLEDVQGVFECVVFPRLWKQTQALWQNEKIILVRGTIDAKGRTPKILVDSATDKPQVTDAIPDKNGRPVSHQGSGTRDQGSAAGKLQEPKKPEVSNPRSAPKAAPPTSNVQRPTSGSQRPSSAVDFVDDRYEPIGDEFDPFAGEALDMMGDPFMADVPAPKVTAPQKPISLVKESTADYAVRAPRSVMPEPKATQSPPPAATTSRSETAPAPKSSGNGNGHGNGNGNGHRNGSGNGYARSVPVRTAKVIISRSGDGLTDAQRVGEVHQVMSTCPGPDKFCFIVMARGSTLQLDFPNDSTTLNDELIAQLKSMPGVESVQVSMM
ncbi:MAG TPA: OB-fold nucleic acid binding domain-containing protein, partial [Anaerolineae bacterium]|nr:OB-fold nucleic acid binding domain-containing protein [Anaerolineae bacterium]